MREETVDQELGRRIRKIFSMELYSLPSESYGGQERNIYIGPIRICRTSTSWLVVMDYGPGKTIVYFDMDGTESVGDNIPKFDHEARDACLKYLRGLLVLEDLGDV